VTEAGARSGNIVSGSSIGVGGRHIHEKSPVHMMCPRRDAAQNICEIHALGQYLCQNILALLIGIRHHHGDPVRIR
jgi:hypothetical protein